MTHEEKRQLLAQYRHIPKAIKHLRELIKKIESEAERVTVAISTDGSGGFAADTAKLQRCVERLDDAKRRLLAEEEELAERKSLVLAAVAALEDGMERAVIKEHYIDGKSFRSLTFTLHYSEAQLFRYAHRGIDNIIFYDDS